MNFPKPILIYPEGLPPIHIVWKCVDEYFQNEGITEQIGYTNSVRYWEIGGEQYEYWYRLTIWNTKTRISVAGCDLKKSKKEV